MEPFRMVIQSLYRYQIRNIYLPQTFIRRKQLTRSRMEMLLVLDKGTQI